MAMAIIPRLVRGRLYFEIGPVLFPTFDQAATAWSATEAHRLDIAEPLDDPIVQRAATLVEMRTAGDDLIRFRTASRREAHLAAQIRRLRRTGGAA